MDEEKDETSTVVLAGVVKWRQTWKMKLKKMKLKKNERMKEEEEEEERRRKKKRRKKKIERLKEKGV